ncbi:hypothetical protein [Saezia sanguinis]|uniref:hypothetical protein n=1 Tax=Saezia sanguinis TaxID=1965230 RepID=UPI001EF60FA8|nr:hypothetical protein [Saezia sanguinis]
MAKSQFDQFTGTQSQYFEAVALRIGGAIMGAVAQLFKLVSQVIHESNTSSLLHHQKISSGRLLNSKMVNVIANPIQ